MEVDSLNIPLPEDLMKLKWNGQFEKVKKMIDLRIQKDIPLQLKERLLLEKEIIDRISDDFIYTKEEAISILKKNIIDFKDEEFDELFYDHAFEFIFINGQMMFKNNFYENLIKTRIHYQKRDIHHYDETSFLDNIIQDIQQKGQQAYQIHVKVSMQVKEEFEQIGNTIKVWLPIPIEYAQTSHVKILNTTPQATFINAHNISHRSVYFEVPLEHQQEFCVEYELINKINYQILDYQKAYQDDYALYLEEKPPHILFTPYLKSLAKEIIQDETNPLIKARKIYDYITTHVMYSYMRPYITLPCISEYAATSLKGDCGVQALLFITLCRIVHIPARWQAGLYIGKEGIGNHDWAMFYVAPYGWLYADCSFGGSAYRAGSSLRHDFYFGHLDPLRIVSASDFQCQLVPPMTSTRKDPYDHQTGEMEYVDQPLNDNQYITQQKLIDIKALI